MLQIRQCTWVYNLLGLFVFTLHSALSYAERTPADNTPRLRFKHNSEVKQLPPRKPASVNAGDHSSPETSLHPVSPKVTEPVALPKIDPNKGTSFPNPIKRSPSVLESTLSGRIEKWVGNMMPARGFDRPKSNKQPLQTKVYILKGKIKGDASSTINLADYSHKVVAVVNTDESGTFQVQLPPGEYTVFAEIEGELYKNSLDGAGNFASVTMIDGKDSVENIIDSRAASF